MNIARVLLVIAAASLVGVAVRTWTAVQPGDWSRRLPIVEHIGEDDWRALSQSEREAILPGEHSPDDRGFRAGGSQVELMRACRFGYCNLWLRTGDDRRFHETHRDVALADYIVRWDARHSLYLLHRPGLAADLALSPSGEEIAVDLAKIRDAVAPPVKWSLGAAVGLVAAAVILRRGRKRRSVEEGKTWVEGRVEEDCTILLIDGTRLPPCGIPAYSAVAAAGVEPGSATFRTQTEARAEVVLSGSLFMRRRQAALEETIAGAWAISILGLTNAPLVSFFLL